MNKIILKIDGMKCGMCEAHVNDLFRKKIDLVKVKSSHTSGQTIIITKEDVSLDTLNEALKDSGYIIKNIKKEEAIKGLFGWH